MDGTGSGALEFEKETPESLLPVLAESGQVVPAIKVIFDRDWSSSYSSILNKCASLKKDEIERICNDNYSDFIDAIDELLGVQLSVNELQTKINSLNSSIRSNGISLHSAISSLILLKQTRRNMDITINKLNRLKYILQLMDKIRDMIYKKKYISALKNLNQLTSHHLIQLQEYSITRSIWDSIPDLMDKIKKQVNSNFDEWMHTINKQGNLLGKLAFEQTKKYIECIHDDDNADNNIIDDNDNDKEIEDTSLLFEKIENLDFNAIYQCIHIHETLGSIETFVIRYNDIRKRIRLKILNESLVIAPNHHHHHNQLNDDKKNKKKNKKKKNK